jgi:hypothetical protein
MKTFTKICLYALVIFFSSSLIAQQSYLNTTGSKAPDKQEWIQQLHGTTIKVPAAPEGSKATGDDCDFPKIITLNAIGDLPYLTSETTNGRGNDYTETCLNDFDEGEDMIFRLDLDFDVTLKFELNPNGTPYSGIAINESCFDNPTTTCLRVSTDTYGTGDAHGFSVALEAGTYYIMVDTWPGPPYINSFDLTISETTIVPNDDCENAQVVGLLNQYFYSTLEATQSAWPNDGLTDVWFSYTATDNTTIIADVCDSDFDTYIEIYNGCPGTLIGFNDDACGFDSLQLQSSVSFSVNIGDTYLIRVSDPPFFGPFYGTGFLNLYEDPGACALVCPPGGTPELEACGISVNDSCAVAKEVFTGDTICGNLWANGGTRDTDWFKLVLSSVSTVKLAVIGEEDVQFGMVAQYVQGGDDCDNLQGFFTEYKITPGCVEDSIKFLNLPAGSYYFVVAPAFYHGLDCPGFDYQAAFTVIPDATGTLAGTVVDETSTGVGGVIIQADVFTTVTAADGTYSLDVPAGTYDVYAWGYVVDLSSDVKEGEVVTVSNTTTVNFTLDSGAPVLTAAADPDFGKANLTWTPVPVKGGLKGTEIVMGEVLSLNDYTPGFAMDLEFSLIVYAPDDGVTQDWGQYFQITLPADFTINSASDFPLYDGSTIAFSQSGQTVYWDAESIPSQFWQEGIEEHIIDFTINVDVALGTTGPLVADYYFEGDGVTGDPDSFDGLVTIYEDGGPYVPTYNVYRKLDNGVPGNYFIPLVTEIPYEELNDVIVAGDKWCYYVTQVLENGLESAPSNEVCVEVKDACDDAIDYGVPGDAAQTFTMSYADQVVWFQVTLPTDMDIMISTCDSDFDTQFAVYDDCDDIPFSSEDLPDDAYDHVTDGCDSPLRATKGYCGLEAGTYYIVVYGENDEFGDIDLAIDQVQCLTMYEGWSGMSIYMDPSPDTNIEDVLADMTSDMVITIRQAPYGIWWPLANINTIGNISPVVGYKAKMNDTISTIVYGTEVVNKEVALPAGASYLPVRVPYEVSAIDLANDLGANLLLIYNIYNPGEIIWPGGNLNNLNTLIPGFAYLINMNTADTWKYPDFSKSANPGQNSEPVAFKGENAAWNTVVNTGNPHINAIEAKAINELMIGDLIGVFNSEGLCVGVSEVTTKEENLALIAFGNSEQLNVNDGLEEDELMRFKLYRPSTDTEYAIEATFSQEMPNHDGLFAVNGLSMITNMKLSPTGINENMLANVNIYPNPSNGLLNISGLETDAQLTVTNAQGQVIYTGVVSGNGSIDLSGQAKGVYLIKLVSDDAMRMTKVVLR